MFFVPQGREYIGYVDFRILAILFCLMSVMAGLQKSSVFQCVAQTLLSKVREAWQLVLILVLLCFFSSMLVTNDETIAANLGSMLTPIENLQNLYLYGKAGLSLGALLC